MDGDKSTEVATIGQPATANLPAPFDFTPTNLKEAMDLAKMLADSTLVPNAYKGKPGDCFIAMQYGHEVGLKPSQSLQSIASINGKPSIYGDAGKALLLAANCRIDEFDVVETKAAGFAQCTITRPNGAKTTRTFSLEDAKTAKLWGKDGPWTTMPYRQMAWRAFWFAARDGAADILKGLHGAEEARDITADGEVVERTVAGPQSKSEAATKAAAASASKANAKDVDPATGEVQGPKAKNGNGASASAGEGGASGEENKTAASAGMIAHIRKRLENATITEAECVRRFSIERLDGITVAQANAIIAWTANPAG